jgi:hypothetical protein
MGPSKGSTQGVPISVARLYILSDAHTKDVAYRRTKEWCFVSLTRTSAPKHWRITHGILGIAEKLSMRQTKLLHLIRANL